MISSLRGSIAFVLMLGFVPGIMSESEATTVSHVYSGMCDASAVAIVDGGQAYLVADDERNELVVYDARHGGFEQQRLALSEIYSASLVANEGLEFDLEAVAQVGDLQYWISSHGRSKSGKLRPSRHLFFATRLRREDHRYQLELVGRPYHHLARDLLASEALATTGLSQAIDLGDTKDESLSPEEGGLNIEGLTETSHPRVLLIGLRNPVLQGKAVLIPLQNPRRMVEHGIAPTFSEPILLDLSQGQPQLEGEIGIRGLAFQRSRQEYLIVAGPRADDGPFSIFRWTGSRRRDVICDMQLTQLINSHADFSPEAIVVNQAKRQLTVFSDDGGRRVPVASPRACKKGAFKNGTCKAKDLRNDREKTFRSITVDSD